MHETIELLDILVEDRVVEIILLEIVVQLYDYLLFERILVICLKDCCLGVLTEENCEETNGGIRRQDIN